MSQVAPSPADEGGKCFSSVQCCIDPPLDGAGVYYLGDYFQSFSFCPRACRSAGRYKA